MSKILDDLVPSVLKNIAKGNVGNLLLGRDLLMAAKFAIAIDTLDLALREQGARMPSAGRRSVYKQVYKAWVEDAGAGIDVAVTISDPLNPAKHINISLVSVPIDKLYLLKDSVTRENWQEKLKDAFLKTEKELRGISDSRTPKQEGEKDEPDFKSLSLPTSVYQSFAALVERIRSVEGEGGITPTQVFEFMLGQFTELDDTSLDYLWRQAHGDMTEEEMKQASTPQYDLA